MFGLQEVQFNSLRKWNSIGMEGVHTHGGGKQLYVFKAKADERFAPLI